MRFQESPDNPEKERISLLAAVRDTFKDVFEQSDDDRVTNQSLSIANMIIQIKSEKWSGEFVDVHGAVVVPDSSVLRLSLNEESKHGVCEKVANALKISTPTFHSSHRSDHMTGLVQSRSRSSSDPCACARPRVMFSSRAPPVKMRSGNETNCPLGRDVLCLGRHVVT